MVKLARFGYKFFYWLVPWWYGFTMTITRKRRWPEVATYSHVEGIIRAIQYGTKWREDPIKGVLDVMMSPRKFQAHIDSNGQLGDCDDHAIYWCTALLKSGLADKTWLGTVQYSYVGGEKHSGHVVCVFEKDGKKFWADYNTPTEVHSQWSWAFDVAARRGKIVQAAGISEVKLRKSGEPKLCKKVKRIIP